MYMQRTEAEATFRALKSELSIRPWFHQKEPRVKAHVLVAFLGYALWVTLKHLRQRQSGIVPQPSTGGVDNPKPLSPMKALSLLSTLQSADLVLYGRARDSPAPYYRTHRRTEIPTAPTRARVT